MQSPGLTSFTSLPKKYILLTYEKPETGQYFYNCTFSPTISIPPGPTGQYEVMINEVLFHNDHPLLYKDIDYCNFYLTKANGADPITLKGTVNRDINIIESTRAQSAVSRFADIFTEFFNNPNNPGFNNYIEIETDNNNLLHGIVFSSHNADYTIGRLEYSVNFGYIFNNVNKSIPFKTDYNYDPDNLVPRIAFNVLRFNGPLNYSVISNLTPLVYTSDERGRDVKMFCTTYNTTPRLGEVVQMASTMQAIAPNLSNLSIQIKDSDDNFVKITSGASFQLTVGPYIPQPPRSYYN